MVVVLYLERSSTRRCIVDNLKSRLCYLSAFKSDGRELGAVTQNLWY